MATSSLRPRDSQRAKVYRADRALWGHPANEKFETEEGLRLFVLRVTTSAFWRERAVFPAQRPVKVAAREEGRRGRAYWNHNRINMPRWTWHAQYALHELAHLAVGHRWEQPSHGTDFVRMLHDLTAEFMGADAALSYRTACFRFRVEGCPSQLSTRPPDRVHEFPLAAGAPSDTSGYEASYRRYRLGQRASAPKLRKGMTAEQARAIRVLVDAELL